LIKTPYCKECGIKLIEEAKFCPSCGTPVVVKENLRTKEMKFIDFTAVEVGWAFNVIITQSSSYSIIITAEEKAFDDIQVTKTGDTLKIGCKLNLFRGLPIKNVLPKTRRVEITMSELFKLNLSGGTRSKVKGFSSSHNLVLGLSGTSSLEMIDMSVGDVRIDLSGSSNLKAKGVANNLHIIASGASHLDLSEFPLHDADVNLSGASGATLNLDGVLDANLNGASHLKYLGQPTIRNIQTSGGSKVSTVS
jgi:hypothetical protein